MSALVPLVLLLNLVALLVLDAAIFWWLLNQYGRQTQAHGSWTVERQFMRANRELRGEHQEARRAMTVASGQDWRLPFV